MTGTYSKEVVGYTAKLGKKTGSYINSNPYAKQVTNITTQYGAELGDFGKELGAELGHIGGELGDDLWLRWMWVAERTQAQKQVVKCVAARDRAKNQLLFKHWADLFGKSMEKTVEEDSLTLASYPEQPAAIDTARAAENAHCMLTVPYDICMGLDRTFGGITGPTRAYIRQCTAEIDAYLEFLLPYVKPPAWMDRPLTLDDLVVVDFLVYTGGYFPQLHNDLEWDIFQGDGYQLWHLMSNDCDTRGNMFVFEVDKERWVPPTRPVVVRTPDGVSAHIRLNDGNQEPAVLESHEKFKDLGMKAKYLAAKPGETFVFGQRLLHISDPRGLPHGCPARKAFNLRVIFREPDGSVKVAVDHMMDDHYTRWQNPTLRQNVNALRRQVHAQARENGEMVEAPSPHIPASRFAYMHGIGRYDLC